MRYKVTSITQNVKGWRGGTEHFVEAAGFTVDERDDAYIVNFYRNQDDDLDVAATFFFVKEHLEFFHVNSSPPWWRGFCFWHKGLRID